MARHKNRTANGDRLIAKHQERYEKWWLGKSTVRGVIEKVEYVGNSVYGVVELTFEDGTRDFVNSRESFKPRKTDLKIL